MQLAGIMIGTADSKKLADFYTKMLGDPAWQQGDWYAFPVGNSAIMIGTHSEVSGSSAEPQRLIINLESADVPADFKRIIEATNATVIAEPYHPGEDKVKDMWLATIADPDGNYVQLATPWKDTEASKA